MSLTSIAVPTVSSNVLGNQLAPQKGADPTARQTQTVLPSQNTQAVVTQLSSGPRTASSGDAKKVDSSFEGERSSGESKGKKEKEGRKSITIVA